MLPDAVSATYTVVGLNLGRRHDTAGSSTWWLPGSGAGGASSTGFDDQLHPGSHSRHCMRERLVAAPGGCANTDSFEAWTQPLPWHHLVAASRLLRLSLSRRFPSAMYQCGVQALQSGHRLQQSLVAAGRRRRLRRLYSRLLLCCRGFPCGDCRRKRILLHPRKAWTLNLTQSGCIAIACSVACLRFSPPQNGIQMWPTTV